MKRKLDAKWTAALRSTVLKTLMLLGWLAIACGSGLLPTASALPPYMPPETGESGGGGSVGGNVDVVAAPGHTNRVKVKIVGAADASGITSRREVAWLGLSAEEASEALNSQLKLGPGVGLVVTYVDPKGPAAKAGLRKNDVLAKLDNQPLVVPAQLRKLVQARAIGDSVLVEFYREGRPESKTIVLEKTIAGFNFLQDSGPLGDRWRDLSVQFQSPEFKDAMREQMKGLHQTITNLKVDKQVEAEIRRSMEEAQKVIREALRSATNAGAGLGPAEKLLRELSRSRVIVDNHARVLVRSDGHNTKSLVNTDDTGTIVLVRNPKLHLTAHDAEGKLVFDGEIETAEQRGEVPGDLWKKVEPLVEKMDRPVPPEATENAEEEE